MTQSDFTTISENKQEEGVDEKFEEKSSVGGVERPHPEAPIEQSRAPTAYLYIYLDQAVVLESFRYLA